MSNDKLKFRTRAIHVGNEPDPKTGAVVTPIHLATTLSNRALASGVSLTTRVR